MKKTVSILSIAILLVGLLCFPAIAPQAAATTTNRSRVSLDNLDFTLVNKTGFEIYSVYVAPHNDDEWGDDVMGRDTLASGESVDIEFSRKEKAKLWDLRVEDKKGEFIEWENFDLSEISKITLYYKNGKATADVQ